MHAFQGQVDHVCWFVGQSGVCRDLDDHLLGRLADNVSLLGRRMVDFFRLRVHGLLGMDLLFQHLVFVSTGAS